MGGRFWRNHRFVEELLVSEYLRKQGVLTPEILAVCWKRARGAGFHGWILTREIPDAINLIQWFRAGGSAQLTEKRKILDLVARALAEFHRAGVMHRDLNMGNLLLERGNRVVVLDLDGAAIRSPLTTSERASNLLRLYRSFAKVSDQVNPLSLQDRRRFLAIYCENDPRLFQSMWLELARRWRMAACHRLFSVGLHS